jgi:hypothetical protein
MSNSLINMIGIAKETEQFYLSNSNTSQILVKFNGAIKNNIFFALTRKTSYQETLNYVLANIMLYLSVCTKITVETNGSIKESIAVGVQHKNLIISAIKYKHNADYIMGHSYIGETKFNNL